MNRIALSSLVKKFERERLMKVISETPKFPLLNRFYFSLVDVHYDAMLFYLLSQVLKEDATEGEIAEFLKKEIPLVKVNTLKREDSNFISIILVCSSRKGAWKFFYEMLYRWLTPGRSAQFSFNASFEFSFKQQMDKKILIGEVQIPCQREWELETTLNSLQILIPEIKLGIQSTYQANRILEMRGVSGSEKISMIQDQLTRLIERRQNTFDYDIFTLMQHFFVVSKEEFKTIRDCLHLVRTISTIYLLRRDLLAKLDQDSGKRYIKVRFKRAKLQLPLGVKEVLGVFVSLNFLKEHEVFEKRHLLKAIQSYIPRVKYIEDSYLHIEDHDQPLHTLYLEIEKEDKTSFLMEEIHLLNQELPGNLRGRIEHLLRPVFMPRNEEEVMKNIILLSQQLKYIRDFPQTIISFDEQTDKELSFTVILVRVQETLEDSGELLFKAIKPIYNLVIEREKKVGFVRGKYPKQAFVMRFRLPSQPFLRDDDSVDLYAARKEVLNEIQTIFGEVRDFNGGMISKQSEIFLSLRRQLGLVGVQHRLLLENFFHSIFPIESRSITKPEPLKALFLMLLKMMDSAPLSKNRRFKMIKQSERDCELVLIEFFDLSVKQQLLDAINKLQIYSRQLLQVHLKAFDGVYLGLIYFSEEIEKKKAFIQMVQSLEGS